LKRYFKNDNEQIDLNKIKYDLALIYAQEKFRYALEHNEIKNYSPEAPHPAYYDEIECLLNEFSTIFCQYFDYAVENMLENLDPKYEVSDE